MKKIQIIIGSTREGRVGDKVGNWLFELAQQRKDFQAELVDLKEWNLPLFNDPNSPGTGNYSYDYTKKWSQKISEGDAYILVTCEYNHGYPASLKNALDHLYKEWNGKPVGFVSYGGIAAGTRAVEQLRQVVQELHMIPSHDEVNIPFVWQAFDGEGKLKDSAALEPRAKMLFDGVVALLK